MHISEQIFEKLSSAVINADSELTREAAVEALDQGIDAYDALTQGLMKGIEIVGEKFGNKEYFISDVLMSAQAMQAGLEILEPHLKAKKSSGHGKVLIGTAFTDIHTIGKNIVKIMLQASGFDVIDIGENVLPETFLENVKKYNPDVLAMSGIISSARAEMEKTIEALEREGLRDRVRIIIGGAATSEEFAKKIDADAYGSDAQDAVQKVKKLIE
ncbi:MAG: corrinoid protein [Candidatus Jordarchaeum sp.]|uniref:corrinoid protein n=1 Tax=Candidatus Jordarchaeum sp. TaxID=2823881 RepID=UPI00404A5661